jgi:hypothetical protein
MISPLRCGGRLPSTALALALGVWVFSGSSVMADGGSGATPGFQGFGRGYHLRYGYGGDALGVGADGGYPFYGGPGYPHPWPCLRRLGPITPFPYYGGPGYPSPGHPHYFGGVGPLVADQPAITLGSELGAPGNAGDYGQFTGVLPYPETYFVPSTAAADGLASGVIPASLSATAANTAPAAGSRQLSSFIPPATGEIRNLPAPGRTLGIDAVPVVDAGGVRGLKISRAHPGTAAEKAGVRAGDVIHSANGYLTTEGGNLAWIIANAAPDNVLKMSVRTAVDGKVHTITAQLR